MQASTPPPRCDVCNYRDGHSGLRMIRCTECQLTVHRECHGMETYVCETFVCWACQAVGKSFQAESHLGNGTRLTICQETRPSRCDFCSVSTGVHAMHPLYDMHGERGRQLFLKDPEPRLVWVHTLCAFLLSTQGLCFGCTRSGGFDGEEEKENTDESDDRSVNPDLSDDDDDYMDFDGFSPVHHFVYYMLRPGEQHTQWTRAVQEKKTSLKCTICGANDRPNSVLRIPIQCSANDPGEALQFRGQHPSLGNDSCTMAVHVGCAMWGGMNPNNVRRVYYYPGSEGVEPGSEGIEPIQCVYCTVHGEDVDKKYQAKLKAETTARKEDLQGRRRERLPHFATVNPQTDRANTVTMSKGSSSSLAASAPDQSVLPSLARRTSGTKQAKPKPKPVTTKADPPKQPKKKWHDNLDKSIAAPVSSVARPTLAKKRKVLASQKSIVTEEVLERVAKDLKSKLISLAKDERKKVLKERKKFWKRELSELESSDFTDLWGQAKNAVGAAILAMEGVTETPLDEDPGDGTIDLSMDDDNVEPSKPAAVAPPLNVGKSGREAGNEYEKEQLPKGGEKGTISSAEAQAMEIDTIDQQPVESVDRLSKLVALKTQVGGAREANIGAKASPSESSGEKQVNIGTEKVTTVAPNQGIPPQVPLERDEANNSGTDVPAAVGESVTTANPPVEGHNCWAHLVIGPHFRNEPYKFGEWDEVEIM